MPFSSVNQESVGLVTAICTTMQDMVLLRVAVFKTTTYPVKRILAIAWVDVIATWCTRLVNIMFKIVINYQGQLFYLRTIAPLVTALPYCTRNSRTPHQHTLSVR